MASTVALNTPLALEVANVHLNPALYIVWSTNLNGIFPLERNFGKE